MASDLVVRRPQLVIIRQDCAMLLQPALRAVAVASASDATRAVERDVRASVKALFLFKVVQVRLTLVTEFMQVRPVDFLTELFLPYLSLGGFHHAAALPRGYFALRPHRCQARGRPLRKLQT